MKGKKKLKKLNCKKKNLKKYNFLCTFVKLLCHNLECGTNDLYIIL